MSGGHLRLELGDIVFDVVLRVAVAHDLQRCIEVIVVIPILTDVIADFANGPGRRAA